MGGKLGSDFDSTKPANSSPVKQGAFWIRDLKGRIKAHLGVLMNLETGDFKDNVIRSEALRDTGVVPGTYSRLTVNSKGQATKGFDSTEQRTARVYRAVFLPDGTGYYDTDVGVTTVAGTSQTYPSDNPFSGTYTAINGSQFYAFTFTVPLNVRRLKVVQVGGGGGGDATYSGGGGQGAIYTIPVTPESSIAIYVGVGGSGGTGGGVSAVDVGSLHVETPGGDGGSGSHGTAVNGGDYSGDVGVLMCDGADGATGAGGKSGCSIVSSNYGYPYGTGATNAGPSTTGEGGIVVLEWVV